MMKKLFVSAAAIAIACAGVGAMAASKTPAKSASFNPFNVTKPARYVLPTAKKAVVKTVAKPITVTPVAAPALTLPTQAPPVAEVRPPYRPPSRSPYVPPRAGPFS